QNFSDFFEKIKRAVHSDVWKPQLTRHQKHNKPLYYMHLCYSTSCVAVICLMDTTFKRLLAYDLTPVQLLQLAQSKLSFLFFLLLRIRLLEGEMCVYIPYFFVLFIDNGDTSQRDKKKDGNQRFNYILKYVTDLIELKISNIHFDDICTSSNSFARQCMNTVKENI
ncbi:hypothetical protein RFI_34759, partial [Reticulomyxa filosa]